jgi:hypothetical protein
VKGKKRFGVTAGHPTEVYQKKALASKPASWFHQNVQKKSM